MLGGVIAVMIAGPALSVAIVDAPEVELGSRAVRLADVAVLEGGAKAERRRLGAQIVASVPRRRSGILLSRAALADLVRRQSGAPAVAEGEGMLRLRYRPAVATRQGGCWATQAPLAVGEPITGASVAPAPCGGASTSDLLRFDRSSGLVRAAVNLPAGTHIGRMAPPAEGLVERGASMALVSTSGPVTLSRSVTALQPGRAGRPLFVRDEDGNVLSVAVAAEAAQ